jgi:hypothetical protein
LSRYLFYKLQIKSGYFRIKLPLQKFKHQWHLQQYYVKTYCDYNDQEILRDVFKLHNGEYEYFFKHRFYLGSTLNWFCDPFNGMRSIMGFTTTHWSQINLARSDYDVKVIWELSRFYWFPRWCQGLAISAQPQLDAKLVKLVNDWCCDNPANAGLNWVCAQEVGIRLINFILGLHILKLTHTDRFIIEFITIHCKRIIPAMSYAKAQNNNHATSEAAALYMAGVWLLYHSGSKLIKSNAKLYITVGRRNLNERVSKLILADGTFAQYSITYHRLVLDTISLVIYWQRFYGMSEFNTKFQQQYKLAFNWLYQLVDPISFNAPNLGANDGTLLFKLDLCDYRDFRPCLQLAGYLLYGKRIFVPGAHDQVLTWLGVDSTTLTKLDLSFNTMDFKCGGIFKVVLDHEKWLFIRYPVFKFRPSQADIFHLDVWIQGRNLLSDTGSYSYHQDDGVYQYLSGTAAHNTVRIDERDQMPRMGKFLFGNWLSCSNTTLIKPGFIEWTAEYKDYKNMSHSRQLNINLATKQIEVLDVVKGEKDFAIEIFWHISAEVELFNLNNDKIIEIANSQLRVLVDTTLSVCKIDNKPRSYYYYDKSDYPVLKIKQKSQGQMSVVKTVLWVDNKP